MGITIFYDELSALARHILKHKSLSMDGDMNTQIRKDENNEFGLHNMSSRSFT